MDEQREKNNLFSRKYLLGRGRDALKSKIVHNLEELNGLSATWP